MPPSSVILKTEPKLESDSPQDPERPLTEAAEQLWELLLEEVEMISPS